MLVFVLIGFTIGTLIACCVIYIQDNYEIRKRGMELCESLKDIEPTLARLAPKESPISALLKPQGEN